MQLRCAYNISSRKTQEKEASMEILNYD